MEEWMLASCFNCANSIYIDGFNKWAWCSIISLINHAIQINIGQKDKENEWRVVDLAEFLYIALLYQAMTNRNINAAPLLEQYSVLVEKEQWGDFFTRLVIMSV